MQSLAIVFALTLLDQCVKFIIEKSLTFGEVFPVLDGFFYLVHWRNKGAAWGILQGSRMFLILVTILALALLAYMYKKAGTKVERIAIPCIAGGAIGNFYDRVFRDGGVVDFLLFRFGTYDFPAFNIADMLIVCGSIFLLLKLLRHGENDSEGDSEGDPGEDSEGDPGGDSGGDSGLSSFQSSGFFVSSKQEQLSSASS